MEPDLDKPASKVELLCPECGEEIRVADPVALIRSLHLQNACQGTVLVVGNRE